MAGDLNEDELRLISGFRRLSQAEREAVLAAIRALSERSALARSLPPGVTPLFRPRSPDSKP